MTPDTSNDYDRAYLVIPYGYIGYDSGYVTNSYGNSPGTDWDDIACYLGPNGNIFENINFYVDSVKDSYGI